MTARSEYIRWFREIGLADVALVGGKNASLGEMYCELTQKGINVPNGFATTVQAYWDLVRQGDVLTRLHELFEDFHKDDVHELAERARQARALLYHAELSNQLQDELSGAYNLLVEEYGPKMSVAVRSSATAEDLPTASFAGQHETYLNIRGEESLLDACRRCFASLFTDRAVAYRINHGFDHFKVALSIGVMKMVRSDLSASGVMFSLDTESGFRDVVFVTSAYGLGENVVQGTVDPDEFYVHKPTFEQGHRVVLRRVLGDKQVTMVYADNLGQKRTRNISTPEADRKRFSISDTDVLTLADYAIKTEQHYSAQAGKLLPMDMEWAKDGLDGQLYLIQARPETVVSQRRSELLEEYHLTKRGRLLVSGRAAGTRIATGRARLISNTEELSRFEPGEVVVADTTTPDWGPVMKTASAIITNRGGRTCHAAIVARELGIPAVVGTETATSDIPSGIRVTVSCAEGDTGKVYEGEIPFEVTTTDLSKLEPPRTQVMLNVGNPEVAFRLSFLPSHGVGLARMEFIINQYIGIHPMALVHPEKVKDVEERAEIVSLTSIYDSPADYFVQRLSEGVGTIAAAFYPRPVVVRTSDFKSNEYANLRGGRFFELAESNPMLGFRGASRYTHPAYAEGFALECAAMKRVRDEMGLTNVKLMIPFCRRVEEGEGVLEAMARHGLARGKNGLEVYVMCEIPNNVIQIDAFSRIFDGISIGSNDLTQLVLGVDRDSEIVAFDFDERDPGVLEMIRLAVEGAKRNGRHSGICGQAPSDYPEMAEFLVRTGIDSISLNPDSVLRTMLDILRIESECPNEGGAAVN